MTLDEFKENINIDKIKNIVNCDDFSKEDKVSLISYLIFKEIEGIIFMTPKIKHHTEYARVLIKYGINEKEVLEKAGVSATTYYRIKKGLENDGTK